MTSSTSFSQPEAFFSSKCRRLETGSAV
uniref:Uncharacterized protein n=1 Tax=Rhizophora mucronata TaxID=61149 RepID=A0A2P2Q274_RHIMU